MNSNNTIYDYIVIGSGFGGAVSAMRLSEKGYSVAVLEMGRKWENKDFPKSNWSIHKFLWLPAIKFLGIQKLDFFKEVFILSGTGVGGGSLVYANTHMVPPDTFFENVTWNKFNNWKEKLLPFYETAKFMLGTVNYKNYAQEDFILKEIAKEYNRESSFNGVNVGVYFGDNAIEKDPYFNGLGPARSGCTLCANCMVGCRYNAKNTLDKNYLYFAEKFGAIIFPETRVTKIEFINNEYYIHTEKTAAYFFKQRKVFKSKGIVVSAGVLGTLNLLLKQRNIHNTLPNLSNKLGENVRTNSESICGVGDTEKKLNNGIAITSVFNPDEHTHIEVVKYGNGSGLMGFLGGMAVGNASSKLQRTLKWLILMLKNPIKAIKILLNYRFPENGIILLVMQTIDNKMKLKLKKRWFGTILSFDNSSGNSKVPAYIDSGQKVMYKYAEKAKGTPMNAITEILFNMSTTAHIIGGCPMGENENEGVVNSEFKVFGYNNFYILDGSIIPCNLGVNPSLTITALSEYAMSKIPEKENNKNIPLKQQLENCLK
jgi:cholesterol oxidase